MRNPHYVIIAFHEIFKVGSDLWTKRLWAKDLELHFRYIDNIMVACPVERKMPPNSTDYVCLSAEILTKIVLYEMPKTSNTRERIKNGPCFMFRLACIARNNSILHVTIGEHTIIFGLLFPAIQHYLKIKIISVVESSSWRHPDSNIVRRLYSLITEQCAKIACKYSDAIISTQNSYVSEMNLDIKRTVVIPAAWVDPNSILSNFDVRERLAQKKIKSVAKFNVAFFGMLTEHKGIKPLIDACKSFVGQGVHVGVYGKGKLKDWIEREIQINGLDVQLMGYIQYGDDFFHEIRIYDCIIVPSLGDEQPRIIYDAFSQGVPVIASSSKGLDSVRDGYNGLRYSKNKETELVNAVFRMKEDRDFLDRLSINARQSAEGFTHEEMHKARAKFLKKLLPSVSEICEWRSA